MLSHINETVGSLRRQIYFKSKISPQSNKIDLIINNECVGWVNENQVLGDYNLKDKMFIIVRVSQTSTGLGVSGGNGNAGGNNNNNGGVNSGVHSSNSASRLDSSAESGLDEYCSGLTTPTT